MTVYGYARISTAKQNIERQVRNIKAAFPEAVIIKESYSGKNMDRPEWNKLMKILREKDMVVFDSVSRMSRNASEGFLAYEALFNRGIVLSFLREPQIDSETYRRALDGNITLTGTSVDCILEGVNRYMLSLAKEQIRIAFAQSEKEVSDLRQRTREGIITARMNGKQIGRQSGKKVITKKSVEAKKKIKECSIFFDGSLSDEDCMKLTGLARNTFYKYKREIKEESEGKGREGQLILGPVSNCPKEEIP